METIRDIAETVQPDGRLDERLDTAQDLLRAPARNRLPGVVPLLAGCAFIGAATLLAYVFTQSPALSPASSKPVAAGKPAMPAGKADFELSGTPKEAVPVGSESAR
ncbi:hypothetical protein [Asticcacaulis sp.]|uniref:hypothetical protein n=1 Tax=Asticcacaulis sp. TaxID=1872648 RepID=UPI003F7C887F